jgi:hemin uptake protein HemP
MTLDRSKFGLMKIATSEKFSEVGRHPIPRVPSRALLGERGELIIEHAGREYRLRQTSTGKLILTA